jgi:hypothetical protein
MRNVSSLHPKPPPKDTLKMIEHLHDILPFKGKMATSNSVDKTRDFEV